MTTNDSYKAHTSDTGAERTEKKPRGERGAKYTPRLLGKPFFQRKKSCPFSGPKAQQIDYKDTRVLSRYVTDYGKILPSHITGVSKLKQRELAIAIKRARHLALMPYSGR